jgi:hypothetical protein
MNLLVKPLLMYLLVPEQLAKAQPLLTVIKQLGGG